MGIQRQKKTYPVYQSIVACPQVCYVAFWAVTDPRNKVTTVTMKSRLSHD
jgi:hypothetical protein